MPASRTTWRRPKRVLFFAEAVTLAHVARPAALAAALAPRHHVVIATDRRYLRFAESRDWETVSLRSIGSAEFLGRLSRGRPVYDLDTLRSYVREDLEIIEKVRPDLIVGDFRLSLSVSARKVGIKYIALTNAYWSPYYIGGFPMPVLPFTKFLPVGVAKRIFGTVSPILMPLHCRPLNQLRKEHGMRPLGNELRRVYTDADCTIYVDLPEMFPTRSLPESHRFLGPVLWSPAVAKPVWWNAVPAERPVVYATVGSSGDPSLLRKTLEALSGLPVTVIASTAGQQLPSPPANAYIAEYLPGVEAAARSELVICNGGSPTSQQALAAGVPVLGIASNMDQFLNMQGVERVGAGHTLRADRATVAGIRQAALALLDSGATKVKAKQLSAAFAPGAAAARLAEIVEA